ncbi:MAG: hypothetical protein GYB51_06830 [Rhodobacteraceae bacterium]|nr:hypothetical protein [Paracoccaceae bacterium]
MAEWLELHHVNVVGGDATLVLVLKKDGDDPVQTLFRGLIDAGSEGKNWGFLRNYLAAIGQDGQTRADCNNQPDKCHFDLIITTHLHTDHIRGFYKMDLRPAWFVDTSSHLQAKASAPDYPDIGLTRGNATESASYSGFINAAFGNKTTKRVPLPFTNRTNGATGAVDLANTVTALKDLDLKMTVVCANGIMAALPPRPRGTATARSDLFALKVNDRTGALGDPKHTRKVATYLNNSSPNDFSIGTFLEWGDFTYFTSGDLSGDSDGNGVMRAYKDLERFVVADLKTAGWIRPDTTAPGIDVVKIAHHGSDHSTFVVNGGPSFLGEVRPRAMIVPTNQKKQVPGPVYLERAKDFILTARQGAASQEATPGLLMSNSTAFGEGTADYQAMDQLYQQSQAILGGTPTEGTYTVPLNLALTRTPMPRNLVKVTLDTGRVSAAVVVKGPTATFRPPTVSDFGDRFFPFTNFGVLLRAGGAVSDTEKIKFAGASFKTPVLDWASFTLKGLLTLSLMTDICGAVWRRARGKAEGPDGTAGKDESYMNKYLPALAGFYSSTITVEDFAATAQLTALNVIQACYDTRNTENQTYCFRSATYRANNIPDIQTTRSLVQTFFFITDKLDIVSMESTELRTALTRAMKRPLIEGTSASSGEAIRKKARHDPPQRRELSDARPLS